MKKSEAKVGVCFSVKSQMCPLYRSGHPAGTLRQPKHPASDPELERRHGRHGSWAPAASVEARGGGAGSPEEQTGGAHR